MATKNIKKILLNKDGDNFVADIENIENRISQNSSNLETAKQELSDKCNTVLNDAKAYTDTKKNEAVTSANNYTDQEKAKYLPLTGIAVHAKTADTSTRATQDGDGSDIASTYIKLASAQTISAQHNFSTGVKIEGCLITVG